MAPFRAKRRALAEELGNGDSDDNEELIDVNVSMPFIIKWPHLRYLWLID